MSVPDTNNFSQRDVVTEIYGDSSNKSLTELFSSANGIFDSNYVGNKDRLSNFRNYQHLFPNGGYGRLYNGYALSDSRNIAPSGWHVPTPTEINTLLSTIGGYAVAGGYLKELSTFHWNSPNISATDSYAFAAVGNGYRDQSGFFKDIRNVGTIGAAQDSTYAVELYYNYAFTSTNGTAAYNSKIGLGVRLIKDDSTNPGVMTDNSGYTYKTIQIGSQVWMASNLRGTKYRNGNDIPVVIDNATWAGLNSGACCSYNNNDAWSYADNYVLNDVYVKVAAYSIFDGTSGEIYANSINTGTATFINTNTDVTLNINYTYYDSNADRTYTYSDSLIIPSGQHISSPIYVGGEVTNITLVSVYPSNNGTYHYSI